MATHELTDAEHATSVMLLAQRAVVPPDVALGNEYLRECFGFTQPHQRPQSPTTVFSF